MCGICGELRFDQGIVDRGLLQRMADSVTHRGPDDAGYYIDGSIGLGMRRLSIIDLVTGHQPIRNEDGTLQIVCNGEIYNFPELRAGLEKKGHRFQTNSDVEVIVHLYEDHGNDCLKKLNGMFAFALWDGKVRKLLLARDRLGKKPMYYYHHANHLLFGSELKCILSARDVPREIDLAALHHYLSLQYVPDPRTIFNGINKLPPAHYLVCHGGTVRVERYWDLPFEPKQALSTEEYEQLIRDNLKEAVKRRLISDVPLGAFLSGGIDSSIIVGLMSELAPGKVKTFSIGFEEQAFSELPYARAVAQKFGTDHHEFVVKMEAANVLPTLVRHFDEPYADSSALPSFYLAKMARQHITVALNGDGGDENFAGYQRHLLDKLIRPYALVPSLLRDGVVGNLLSLLPESSNRPVESNYVMALKRLSQAASISRKASIIRWGSYFSEDMKRRMYSESLHDRLDGQNTAAILAESFDRAHARAAVDKTLYVDIMNYLPGDLLVKMDRMTMAHSLETRSPFLDYEFMEMTARIPDRLKLHGLTHKYILKKAFRDLLPSEVVKRRKMGFGIPLGIWFRGELKELANDLLLSTRFRERGYFRNGAVEGILKEHDSGRVDHGKRLWALLMLEMWHREYADGQ